MTDNQQRITANKHVQLSYEVIDAESGNVLTSMEEPLAYVHGVNEILAPAVMMHLEGKAAGEVVEVPIDCNQIYGPRDESLVLTESVDKVPEEYRKIGTAILMENNKGQTKSFLVTKIEGTLVTFDGNNPLCGKEVIYKLSVLAVRDATPAEIDPVG